MKDQYSNFWLVLVGLIGMLISFAFGFAIDFSFSLLFMGVFISLVDVLNVFIRRLVRHIKSRSLD